MCSEKSKRLVIELAKSLGIDFPKDKTCKDCFHYEFTAIGVIKPPHHCCWEEHKVTTRPCDPDDMCHMDYTDPYIIEDLSEAMKCPYYLSGLEEYKRLYTKTQKELKDLKNDIRSFLSGGD